jgi:hypothetical protein
LDTFPSGVWRLKKYHWSIKFVFVIFSILWGFATLIGIAVLWVSISYNPDYPEVARITSPDGMYDAVLVTDNSEQDGMLMYITTVGDSITTRRKMQLEADRVRDISMKWLQSNLLEVRYKAMRINHFRNVYYHTSDETVIYHVIEIALVKADQDVIKPPGAY